MSKKLSNNTVTMFASFSNGIDFFISSWMLMLCLGGLHHSLNSHIPAPSYWLAALIVLTLWSVIPQGIFRLTHIHSLIENSLKDD